MGSVRGRGGEGAVVSYCFGEEEWAEEEEEGLRAGRGLDRCSIIRRFMVRYTFARKSWCMNIVVDRLLLIPFLTQKVLESRL